MAEEHEQIAEIIERWRLVSRAFDHKPAKKYPATKHKA